ncbi:MAG: penicillin-binding transpeptidase domain-containing protein, partial [Candidatus Eiseniibacteriota bacterium]
SMLAALQYKVARPTTTLEPCTGHYEFGDRVFGCWKPAGHGVLNLVQALEYSCDVYFYQLGPRIGLDHLVETARAFGIGERTGIDLPQERRGLLPDAAWYNKRWGAGHWRKGTMLNLVIGQGELLVTPLQLAVMTAEVAERGRALRAHVVQSVGAVPDYRPERPLTPGFVTSAANWDAVQEGMFRVIDAGTGTLAKVPGLAVAGKTGTAQNPHGKDHALFVCYAPADHPQIAMAFVVENSGHGGVVAGPLAARILRKLFLPDSLAAHVRAPAPVDTAEAEHAD